MRHRKYSIKGRIRFEDALRVELHRQLRELREENEALKRRIEELLGKQPDSFMDWPLSKFHEMEDSK